MDENINESVETQEVAEPEMDEALESAEMQDVADPDESEESHAEETESARKTESDAAFAEMRRTNKALEKANKQMREALSRYFEGETDEELSINALAYAEQRDPEEYRDEYERREELESLQEENEDLKAQLLTAQAERMMREDLAVIQEINPDIKSLDDVGESFLKMRLEGGLSVKEAYYACKAMELQEKVIAPDAIGRVSDNRTERDYYTPKEVDALTDEELDDPDVWAKVMKSMERW